MAAVLPVTVTGPLRRCATILAAAAGAALHTGRSRALAWLASCIVAVPLLAVLCFLGAATLSSGAPGSPF